MTATTARRRPPDESSDAEPPGDGPLIVACAALTADLRAVLGQLGADELAEVRWVPAQLHNHPDRIVEAIVDRIGDRALDGRDVLVGFADCGTAGEVDALVESLRSRGARVARLPGAHCYEFFAGDRFTELHDAAPGTFYLTDFLAKHFDALVWAGLGLDRHPELTAAYFGNYTDLVLLSQTDEPDVLGAARAAADRLGLRFRHVHVGRAALAVAVDVTMRSRAA